MRIYTWRECGRRICRKGREMVCMLVRGILAGMKPSEYLFVIVSTYSMQVIQKEGHTKLVIHLTGEQRKGSTEATSQNRVRSQY